MKKIVLDCSVIIKWFFTEGEERILQAKKLRDECITGRLTILAPELLFLEVINASILGKKATSLEVERILNFLLNVNLVIIPATEELFSKVAYYSRKYKISAYDSVYIALAKEQDMLLITEDQKLINKTKLKFIKTLKNIKLNEKEKVLHS